MDDFSGALSDELLQKPAVDTRLVTKRASRRMISEKTPATCWHVTDEGFREIGQRFATVVPSGTANANCYINGATESESPLVGCSAHTRA